MSESNVTANDMVSDRNTLSSLLSIYRNRRKNIDYDALTQFVEGLRSDLELAQKDVDPSETSAIAIATKISSKLDEADSHKIALDGKWNLAYHAEKLILSLLGAERQRIELYRRLSECQRTNAPFTSFYDERIEKYENESDNTDECFNLLVSLVRDMQHFNSNKHIKMRYARHAIYRVGMAFFIALILFLSIISLFHWT